MFLAFTPQMTRLRETVPGTAPRELARGVFGTYVANGEVSSTSLFFVFFVSTTLARTEHWTAFYHSRAAAPRFG